MENIDKNTIEEYSKYYNECFGVSKDENDENSNVLNNESGNIKFFREEVCL